MTTVAALVGALDEDQVTPGVLGFLIVVALGVATWLLVRSMLKQVKKIDFDESEPEPGRGDRPRDRDGQD